MDIEILHIEECANWQRAGDAVRSALDQLALADVGIRFRLLSTSAEAAAVPFAGSPTVLIDGADAFPSDGRTSDLACRIYRTQTGFAGAPTVEQLVEVLERRGVTERG